MGIKLLWSGLTIIVALSHYVPHFDIIGGIVMGTGLVLYLLDK